MYLPTPRFLAERATPRPVTILMRDKVLKETDKGSKDIDESSKDKSLEETDKGSKNKGSEDTDDCWVDEDWVDESLEGDSYPKF